MSSQSQVAIIGLPGRDDTQGYSAFIERHGLSHLPHLEDADEALWNYFGISSQPAWIFFDLDGRVTRGRGALPDELFRSG
ncbi:MAG: TlpA family protein disulfide reductase [Candidatus Poriferisodalaceae bacterium]|nr:MAG: hypothetical protein CNE88_09140 [Acidimicrobiales bacterium MED-G01]